MKTLTKILIPKVNLHDYHSKCNFKTWYLSVITDFFNHHKIHIKNINLEFGYNGDLLYAPPNPKTQWLPITKNNYLEHGEQDLMRVTITMHTPFTKDAYFNQYKALMNQLLYRCRDYQWPYLHQDWNSADPVPWANWTECQYSCKHYSDIQIRYNTIILTWAPCWCS